MNKAWTGGLIRRYPTNLEVVVTDLAVEDRVASGLIVDISRSGVCADLSLRFGVGAMVKLQVGDCTLFGHVVYCTERQVFRTGIEVVRVLIGQSDLAQLVHTVLSETMPTTPERRFEMYRLRVVQSMPDSDLKAAHVRAIEHRLKRLDTERPGVSGDLRHHP